ncbi:hypothetical protein [Mesorhizobium sp. M0522]|uniref:hypothetical protein n=1 Tax=Mesorhizobium sp. M0522 TaxID=2956958 RepID=UPI003338630F
MKLNHLNAVIAFMMATAPATAKETEFIEQAALLGVYRDVCRQPVEDETIMISIGSAMVQQALPRETVIARATKRDRHIRDYVLRSGTQNTFCEAFMYYLKNGYPK